MSRTHKVCPLHSPYYLDSGLTELQAVEKRSESPAQSDSEEEVIIQQRVHRPLRIGLTLISQDESTETKRKSGQPDGPTLTWTKTTCFALGLTVAHQKKPIKNGRLQTDWKAVLPVINDIFPREMEGFTKIYAQGLPKASKLRSQYSDHKRGRANKWLLLNRENCTPEEIKEMTRMKSIVFETEQRLSQLPGSLVLASGPNAIEWLSFTVQPKPEKTTAKPAVRKRKRKSTVESDVGEHRNVTAKQPKTATKPAARKRKRKATPESEAEMPDIEKDQNLDKNGNQGEQANGNDDDEQEATDEQGDGGDNKEQENPEEDADGDHNDEEDRSNDKHAGDEESSGGSHDSSSSNHDSDEDCIIVTTRGSRRVVDVNDEDEDAESASDEEQFMNAADALRTQREKKAQRGKSATRQTHPQRKKSHLNEVHLAYEDDEDDEQPAPSKSFQDAVEAGTYGNHVRVQNVLSHQSSSPRYTADDLVKTRDQFLQPVDDVELLPPFTRHKTGALDNAIIQSKAAALVGNQDTLQILPDNQKELLRRHRQNVSKALRYGENRSLRLSGLAPPAYPSNPPRVYYGDGHTDHTLQPLVYSYSALRRTLMIAFQARHWVDVWFEIKRVPGFVQGKWNIIADLIDPIVASTGISRQDVTEAVNIATHRESISSLKLAKLLAMPIKINKREQAEPDATLDNNVQQINIQTDLQMLHTNDIDFATEPPTYTFRKMTSGSGNDFRFVQSSDSLYALTGEVRRVLLKYDTTGQGKEVDVMLCDKPLCSSCEPRPDMYPHNFEYSEQRNQLPLVHHKDVAMFEDGKLYFVPMQQEPVLDDAAVVKRDIHEVVFGNDRAIKVVFCDRELCGACKGKEVSCLADLVLPWRR